MTVAILYREELAEYDFGPGHPFRGDRYQLFPEFLKKRLPPDNLYQIVSADYATREDLLKICEPDYIDFNKEFYQAASAGWIGYYENYSRYQSPDNKPYSFPGRVEEAARLIIGQAKLACDLIQSNKFQKVISIGGGMHHAKQRFGEGFCIYNDVAFCALRLIETYNLKRVLVLDTDAHAGNGTAEYFRGNPNVLFIDIHQDPRTIYPGTGFASDIGVDDAQGLTVNIPMPVNAGNESYGLVFDQIILPVTREYKPQIIIRNGGSDPYYEDGLTSLGMTLAGFKMMGEKVREMTGVCDGKQIDLIASGYNKNILPSAWLSLLSGIADFPIVVEEPRPVPSHYRQDQVVDQTLEVIDTIKKYQRPHWKCFR